VGLSDGQRHAEPDGEVCRAFGISRKTGYKIFERYKDAKQSSVRGGWLEPMRTARQKFPVGGCLIQSLGT
jgi:hypothetical protein